MDLKSTIDIILKDLKEARDIMDDLKNYPDVPEIQIELAKAKCRSAEEVLKFLAPKTDSSSVGADLQISTEVISEDTEAHKESHEKKEELEKELVSDIDSKDNIDVFKISDFEEEHPPNPLRRGSEKEDVLEKEDIIDQIIQTEKDDKQPVSDDADTSGGKILADKFSRESSINESIASRRHDKEGEDVSKLKPVSNLADAIGINDRFQYVRELFNGDQDLYRQTITSLNNAANIDEAFDILSRASRAEKDDQSFDQLLELVKRKLRTR